MEENILVTQSEGIATVTFNRPEQRNAISYHGWLQLRKIISTWKMTTVYVQSFSQDLEINLSPLEQI